jgi:hypothetical protein
LDGWTETTKKIKTPISSNIASGAGGVVVVDGGCGGIGGAGVSGSSSNDDHDYGIIIIIIIIIIIPCNSLELTVIPTAQASSFTLQYFPYYV